MTCRPRNTWSVRDAKVVVGITLIQDVILSPGDQYIIYLVNDV